MTFKELAQQTAGTTSREGRSKLNSSVEAEPSAREEPGWKGQDEELGEAAENGSSRDSPLGQTGV